MQLGGLGAAIDRLDTNQNIVGSRLGVFDEDVEVAVAVEDSGIDKLELVIAFAAPAILFDQPAVGKFGLRVLVEKLHIGVGRRRIKVVIVFLGVFAVIALAAGQAENALLEDGVATVPKGESEADQLVFVRDSGKTVLTPAVGAAARLLVRKGIPRSSVGAVVLAHRAPLPLGEIGTPALPVDLALAVLLKS